jgi:phage terminase large subunit GpA-like protein
LNCLDSIFANALFEGLKPEERLKVSEWADKYRVLSSKASAEPGQYKTERTPYAREIMDVLSSDDPTEEVVFMKAAQVGATELGNNWLGYIIDHAPAPIMAVQPTVEMAKRNSKSRIATLIEECPNLKEKVKDPRSRDSSNTVLSKEFPGGILIMTGANSATGLRSLPARYIFGDEVDAYPLDADGEGSPIDLAKARARTFTRRKYFWTSTPTTETESVISRLFEASDQRYYNVPCPFCGHPQKLVFESLKWEKDKPETTKYKCINCEELIENYQKTAMLEAGEWIAENPESKIAGFHLNALYSPVGWYSWGEIARDFLKAKKSPDALRTFVNTVVGETWKEKSETPDWRRLYERRETYKIGTVNEKVGFLVAGADVQKDRIEVEVVGYCRDMESYSIDYRVLMGDTAGEAVWNELAKLLDEPFPVEGNERVTHGIRILAVDSGYNTQHVYNWVRKFSSNRVIAVKGKDNQLTSIGKPSPADVTISGKTIRRGVKVWGIGVNIIKTELYGWLRQNKPSVKEDGTLEEWPKGYCHFPEYDEEFFKQLTAEEAQVKVKRGYKKIEWVKTRERNESLDTRVYARAASAVFGADRFSEAKWKKLAKPTPVKVTSPKESEPKPKPKKRKRRESDFW